MTISNLRYFVPRSIEEALNLAYDHEEAFFMGGGTDFLVDVKEGLIKAGPVIGLEHIPDLRGIRRDGESVRIGACVTPAEIIDDPLIGESFPALAAAASTMASAQIRAMATIGGNIVSAVPSADLPPILIAAGATVELACRLERREVPLMEFFVGPRITVCRENEILTCVRIPKRPPQTGLSYQKFSLRNANALAVAAAASRLTLRDGIIEAAVVVLGAVAPNPLFAAGASAFLEGKKPGPEVFKSAAVEAKKEALPISDLRGSEGFRRELIEVLTGRSLTAAWAEAEKKPDAEDGA